MNAYLALTNVLACVDESQAWILAEAEPDVGGVTGDVAGKNGRAGKRRVVTLEDVRMGYQVELDRLAAVESGRFGIVDFREGGGSGDEMDMDMDVS